MKLHIKKQSYDGYCVGQGVEYPGIVVSAKSDEELKKEFMGALPGHKELLARGDGDSGITVIEIGPE